MGPREALIGRPRPRQSSRYAAYAVGFISVRAAIIRYRRRRRTQTAKRAGFGLASSTYSVLSKPPGWSDRKDDRHRAGESQNRPPEPRLQHPPSCHAGADGYLMREECARYAETSTQLA